MAPLNRKWQVWCTMRHTWACFGRCRSISSWARVKLSRQLQVHSDFNIPNSNVSETRMEKNWILWCVKYCFRIGVCVQSVSRTGARLCDGNVPRDERSRISSWFGSSQHRQRHHSSRYPLIYVISTVTTLVSVRSKTKFWAKRVQRLQGGMQGRLGCML